MRLRTFKASKVHGYLEFDVEFRDRLTFLTGINGGGKTTILNLIVALLSPSLITLAELGFYKMALSFEHNGIEHVISCAKNANRIVIACSGVDKEFSFNRYVGNDTPYVTSRDRDAEVDYYRTVLSTSTEHAVLRMISALPIPMFLGLDRRVTIADESTRRPIYRSRFTRNMFGSSLAQGVSDAIALAEDRYRSVLRDLVRIELQSRNEVLLRSLTIQPTQHFNDLMLPTRQSLAQIKSMRRDIETLPRLLGLKREDVLDALIPTIELLENLSKTLPLSKEGDSVDQVFKLLSNKENRVDDESIQRAVSWSVNYQVFKRIGFISEIVERYNKETLATRRDVDHYLTIVNRFLKESTKHIVFDSTGTIQFKVGSADADQTVQFLSSGETQIFVLITQLYFNKAANLANVFIIDEPELSLHIEWQEIFVDSIMEANGTAQLILASHSPSIILDRVAECIEIKPKLGDFGVA